MSSNIAINLHLSNCHVIAESGRPTHSSRCAVSQRTASATRIDDVLLNDDLQKTKASNENTQDCVNLSPADTGTWLIAGVAHMNSVLLIIIIIIIIYSISLCIRK